MQRARYINSHTNEYKELLTNEFEKNTLHIINNNIDKPRVDTCACTRFACPSGTSRSSHALT